MLSAARSTRTRRWSRMNSRFARSRATRRRRAPTAGEQIRIALVGERAAPEGGHLDVEGCTDPSDLAAAHRGDSEGLGEVLHQARADAGDVGLLEERQHGSLGPSPRFEQAREVRIVADRRNREADRADLGVPNVARDSRSGWPARDRAHARPWLILTNDDRLSDGHQPQKFRPCVCGIRGGRVGVSVRDLPLAVLPAEHCGCA